MPMEGTKPRIPSVWRRAFACWGPVAVYMAVLFILSEQPRIPAPLGFDIGDKVEHAAAYFGLGLFVLRAAVLSPLAARPGPYAQALTIVALYGASDEFHQRFVPGRSAEVLDWIADVVGVAAALIGVVVIRTSLANGGRWIGRRRERL